MTKTRTPKTLGLWLVAIALFAVGAGLAYAATADVWQRDQNPNGFVVVAPLVQRSTSLANEYVEGGRSATIHTRIGAKVTGPYLDWANSSGTLPFTLGVYGTGEVWGYFDANGNFEAAALGIGNIPAANNNGHFAVPTYTGTPSSTPSTSTGYAAFGLCKDSNELCAYNPYTAAWVHFASTAGSVTSLAVGSSGTDFNVSAATGAVTINLPSASATNRGAVTTGAQTLAGAKTFTGTLRGNTAIVLSNAGATDATFNAVQATKVVGMGDVSGAAGASSCYFEVDSTNGTIDATYAGVLQSTQTKAGLAIAAQGTAVGAAGATLDLQGAATLGLGNAGNTNRTTLNVTSGATAHAISLPATVCGSGQGWQDNGSGVMSCATSAPVGATFITETANSTLTNEFALASLATGILKNTTTTGVPSIATSGTDYSAGTSGLATGIIKSTTGTGALSIGTSGTDYSAGTSALATGMLKSTTGTGALTIGTAGTDYSAGTSGLATGILATTTGTGALSVATAGSGISITGTTISATSTGGSCVGWAQCECQTLIANAGLTNATATCWLEEFNDTQNSGLGIKYTTSLSLTGAASAVTGVGIQCTSGATALSSCSYFHVAGSPDEVSASATAWGESCYGKIATAVDSQSQVFFGALNQSQSGSDYIQMGVLGTGINASGSNSVFTFANKSASGAVAVALSTIAIDTAYHTFREWYTGSAMKGQVDSEAAVSLVTNNPTAAWGYWGVAADGTSAAARTGIVDHCVFVKPGGQ